MPPPKRSPAIKDLNHQNEIWKTMIKTELYNAREWEKRWGFFKEEMDEHRPLKLPTIDSKFIPKQSGFPSKLPPGLSNDPDSSIQAYLGAYAIRSLTLHSYPQEKYSLPPTSLSEYGWGWDKKLSKPFGQDLNRPDQKVGYYSLEGGLQDRRGLHSIHKWWGGGQESFKKFDRSVPK